MYSTDADGTTEEKPNAFDHADQLSLVTLMRIYDVMLALLNEQNEEVATKLYQAHAEGRVLASLPWLDMQDTEG